ncbi:hypothetical protein ACFLQR_02265 [Verrucomicrobiota bacterium]
MTELKNGLFDRTRVKALPLSDRVSDLDLSVIRDLDRVTCSHKDLGEAGRRVQAASQSGSASILMIGAHVLRSGVQRYLIDLMERGLISCLAMNGAGVIHDYEFALKGVTTESVARYVSEGQFGLWRETGEINTIVSDAASRDMGLGEAVGKAIEEVSFPHKDISVLAAGWRLGVPITVHVGIGYDIVFEHANCDGAAYGQTSYHDFLKFTHAVERLEGGIVMNFGSAVMAPEIFLKALAMVRNAAHSENKRISKFTTLVCDLVELPDDFRKEPPRTTPGYYFRPWKTMLVRTVADGGESFYVRGDHKETVPQLWTAATEQSGKG